MRSPLHPVQLTLGLIIWALFFIVLYASLSIACQQSTISESTTPINGLSVGLFIFTLAVTAGLLYQARRVWRLLQKNRHNPAANQPTSCRAPGEFIGRISVAVYLVAALACLLSGLPAIFLKPCI